MERTATNPPTESQAPSLELFEALVSLWAEILYADYLARYPEIRRADVSSRPTNP